MQRRALDVFGERVLFGDAAFANNAGHRCGLGKAFLLHEEFEGSIAAAASRDLKHAGFDTGVIYNGTDAKSLQEPASRDVFGELLDRYASLYAPNVRLA